jgi:hypothetical protein
MAIDFLGQFAMKYLLNIYTVIFLFHALSQIWLINREILQYLNARAIFSRPPAKALKERQVLRSYRIRIDFLLLWDIAGCECRMGVGIRGLLFFCSKTLTLTGTGTAADRAHSHTPTPTLLILSRCLSTLQPWESCYVWESPNANNFWCS